MKVRILLFFLIQNFILASGASGVFIGAEFALGSNTITQIACNLCTGNGNNANNTYHTKQSSVTAFDAGLTLGYQHFFDKPTHHGIKISLHVSGGTPNGLTIATGSGGDMTVTTHFIPIKTGIDIKYLFNFYATKEHLVGFGIGVGYGFNYYLSHHAKFYFSLMGESAIKTQSFIAHGIYPIVSLHYIFNQHHIFELGYRYNGLIDTGTKSLKPNPNHKISFLEQRIKVYDFFSLSYSYLF